MEKKKIILGYSGGLDTTFSLKYLQEECNYSVICAIIDIGQDEDLDASKERAEKIGCEKVIIVDGKEDFVNFFIKPSIQANALYQDQYPLATALGRPYIGYKLAEVAKKEATKLICHGCTGKGNDQLRIEMGIKAVLPDVTIIDAVRDEGFSRDTEIEYLSRFGIEGNKYVEKRYSIDENIWGRAICAGDLEDPWNKPAESAFEWTKAIENTKNDPDIIKIKFDNGIPVAIDDKEMNCYDIIEKLNGLGGEHGVGRIDHIEDRIIGLKSREIYEAPAAIILIKAHKALEGLVLPKHSLAFKKLIDTEFANIIYNGFWFSSHTIDILNYLKSNQRAACGTIRVKLFRGNCVIEGRKSPNSLYDINLITYTSNSQFDQKAAKNFVDIYSIQNNIEVQKRFITMDKEIFKIEGKE